MLGSAEMGPTLAVVCEASSLALPTSCLVSPLFWDGLVVVMGWVGGVVVYLGGGVAGDGASGTLGEAGGLVKVGLAGGRVAVRHDGCGW